jgi:hypothetical protein
MQGIIEDMSESMHNLSTKININQYITHRYIIF